jgi:hypothetical protein
LGTQQHFFDSFPQAAGMLASAVDISTQTSVPIQEKPRLERGGVDASAPGVERALW